MREHSPQSAKRISARLGDKPGLRAGIASGGLGLLVLAVGQSLSAWEPLDLGPWLLPTVALGAITLAYPMARWGMTQANRQPQEVEPPSPDLDQVVDLLARVMECKDATTSGHSHRVARLSVEIGEWLNFSAERLRVLELGALLHDIGKLAIPDRILLKPSALDAEEFELMKKHPAAAEKILNSVHALAPITEIVCAHHERWDGLGYPSGRAAEEIPLEGRIVAIADAYDALISRRPYKPAMSPEEALRILEKDAGTQFDPELTELFVRFKRAGKGFKAVRLNPSSALSPTRESGKADRATLTGRPEA